MASPLPAELVSRFFERLTCELHNLYGPTEAAIDVTYYQCHPQKDQSTIPIGCPIANTQMYILDDLLQPVPLGVAGELHIGGVGLARGYLNRPDLTSTEFIPNPFNNSPGTRLYKTGDKARYLPDGNIEFLGRIDNQVKIRGFRIELGEIEATLAQHPLLREAVVIAREDIPGDKRLVAYIVANAAPTTARELRDFLKAKLPGYMVPATFVTLEAMSLTPNGKVSRRALPAPDTSQRSSEAGLVLPRDTLEMQLMQIWSDVLGVHPIGVRDNFFELGGHSLLAVRLMAQIEQQFGTNLLLGTLFQTQTIEQLASLLRDGTESTPKSPLVAIQPKGNRRPFFCVPGAGGNAIYFYGLAHHLGNDQPFYAFQAVGLDGKSKPHNRCEDMAAHYIEALQTVQPQGPYQLGGHSFGGLVAFEMAQQLQKQGHEVRLVAILDTHAQFPRQPSSGEWDDATWMLSLAGMIEKLWGKNLDVSYEDIESMTPDEQLNYFKERLEMVNLLPPESGIRQVEGLVEVIKANSLIYYEPKEIYPTRISLFRTSESQSDPTIIDNSSEIGSDETWGWNQFSSEPVETHFVPGNHWTMLANPHVRILAERLLVSLDQII